jgi:ABC-type sugar transport system ATPase subunit
LIMMSDRVGIMSEGRIVNIKPAREVTKTDLIRPSVMIEAAA